MAKTNPNVPAFPWLGGASPGLNQRAYIATQIYAEMLTGCSDATPMKYLRDCAATAARAADCLILELNKEEEG